MKIISDIPFDAKRMILGCFKPIRAVIDSFKSGFDAGRQNKIEGKACLISTAG